MIFFPFATELLETPTDLILQGYNKTTRYQKITISVNTDILKISAVLMTYCALIFVSRRDVIRKLQEFLWGRKHMTSEKARTQISPRDTLVPVTF